jgi:hypothetical protein
MRRGSEHGADNASLEDSAIEPLRRKSGPMSTGARLQPEQQETSRAIFQGTVDERKTGDSLWGADNATAREGFGRMIWGWVLLMTEGNGGQGN